MLLGLELTEFQWQYYHKENLPRSLIKVIIDLTDFLCHTF